MTDKLFQSETALVTGAASSIGRGIARALAKEGARVTLVDIDTVRCAETADLIATDGGAATCVVVDLSKPDGHTRLFAAVGDTVFDMFVHSASPPRHEKDGVRSVDEATWDAMVNTNARSGFFIGRELGRRMVGAKKSGRMLYLTSLHASSPRNLPHYSAGKGAMRMVMMEMARAFGPQGIRVNALAPGAVPGGGAKNITDEFRSKIPMGRVGTPDDMAATAVAMLSNRFMPYVTGATISVDGGLDLYNWIPFAES